MRSHIKMLGRSILWHIRKSAHRYVAAMRCEKQARVLLRATLCEAKKNCETPPVALCNSLDKMLKKWHSVGGPLTNLSLIGTGRLKEE